MRDGSRVQCDHLLQAAGDPAVGVEGVLVAAAARAAGRLVRVD